MVNNQVQGFLLTAGHLKLLLFAGWVVGLLPLITWWALTQFLPVTYLQVFCTDLLLCSLVVTEELVRGFVTKGQ